MPRRLSYSPATAALRRLFAAHAESERTGVPVDEVQERTRLAARQRSGLSRRAFLGGATATAGMLAWPATAEAADTRGAGSPAHRGAPRILVVGAGLAGLRAAHALWTGHHLRSTVYEADVTHVGGRCWSLRGFFDDGLIGEHGGAFINSDQPATRRLARRLGLQEEVANGGDLPQGEEVYWFDGARYTHAEAQHDWATIGYRAFRDASRAAPWPQLYNHHNQAGRRLDHLSVPEWLDETEIGSTSRFGKLMMANAVSEYGGDPSRQSALNLIYLLADNARSSLQPLPGYDEKYHIVGGNDQIVHRMIGQLPAGTVRQGYELVALRRDHDGAYTAVFDHDGRLVERQADHVVLALPFTKLAQVDLRRAGLSPFKLRTIRSGVLGTNAKIHVEVSRKTWPALGYSGTTYTNADGFCCAWDDSVPRGPHGRPAILLGFPGGHAGAHTLTGAAHGPAPAADVTWFLDQIERVYPGTKAAYTGRAYEDHWSADRWHHGAYSYWSVGQETTTAGYEGVQEGRIHFAGEHTEPNDQGFLDGAVVSGQRVCREIVGQI
jgi:monoamine oxidase